MWIVVIWAALSIGVGFLADDRGQNGIGFALFSLFLSPLLALIVLLVMPNRKLEQRREEDRRRQHERELESIRAIANSAAAQPEAKQAEGTVVSVADELEKLAALRDKGILTEVEFIKMKMELLAPKA